VLEFIQIAHPKFRRNLEQKILHILATLENKGLKHVNEHRTPGDFGDNILP